MSAIEWFIKVDGVKLPTPDSCPITEYDIDSADAGRVETGVMYRERIRTNTVSMDITWNYLTVTEATTIRTALTPVSFSVQYYFLGTTKTITMYAGDLKWQPVFDRSGNERWQLQVQLTEY